MAFLHLVIVCSALHSLSFATRCLFWDSNHFVSVFLFWHDICLSTEAVYQTENAVPTLSLSMGVDDLRQ